jgi:hypothetical protein
MVNVVKGFKKADFDFRQVTKPIYLAPEFWVDSNELRKTIPLWFLLAVFFTAIVLACKDKK